LDGQATLPQLRYVFELLGLAPSPSLAAGTLRAAWAWARERWDINRVPKRLALALDR
jgi:hypothetical protein